MGAATGFLPASEVILIASQAVGDPSRNIVGRGRYLSFVQRALTQMCLDVEFDVKYHDVPIPSTGVVALPQWMAGLRNVWVYNGDCDTPNGIVNVYEKEGFVYPEVENPTGSFSYNMQNGNPDSMQANSGWWGDWWGASNNPFLRWYGLDKRKAKMYLSPSCTGFTRIKMEYAGLGFDAFCGDETLEVPIWASEAIADFVTMKAAEQRQFEEGRTNLMRAIYKDKEAEFKSPTGSWFRAMGHWGQMDSKERKDTVMYISRMGHAFEHF